MRWLVLLTSLFLLQSCDAGYNSLDKTHDAEGEEMIVKINVFSSHEKLNDYIRKNDIENATVDGLAQWRLKKNEDIPYRCDIFVVRPKRSNDYELQETWGHELMHCVYGSYHKPNQR